MHLPLPTEAMPEATSEAEPEKITPNGLVLLVLGGPGSGKDTQCERLAAKYGCVHLSSTELMRTAVTSNSQQGAMISNMIRAGQIVPAQVTLDLLKAEMQQGTGPYLVQGYPKTLDNLKALEAQCGACGAALNLQLSEAVLTERLVERGKTSNRTDDSPEAIARRFKTFQTQSMPVVDELHARGVVTTVDAAQPVEAVFEAACAFYDKAVG